VGRRNHILVRRLHGFTPSPYALSQWAATVAVWKWSTTDTPGLVGWEGKARMPITPERVLSFIRKTLNP
jgi:hypothetical protein